MLSESSSMESSTAVIMASTSGTLFISPEILSSRSKSLMAKNRFCSCGISSPSLASILSSASSTSGSNRCTGALMVFLPAILTAFSTASFSPLPLRAEISTTSQPRSFDRRLTSILSPFFSTRSIIFTAMTTGMPSSVICVVR